MNVPNIIHPFSLSFMSEVDGVSKMKHDRSKKVENELLCFLRMFKINNEITVSTRNHSISVLEGEEFVEKDFYVILNSQPLNAD